MTTFNAQAGFQPDADSIARRLNALESGTGISLVGPLFFPNGSAAAPSIAFANQPGRGWLLNNSNGGVNYVAGGLEYYGGLTAGVNSVAVNGNVSFGFCPPGLALSNPDVVLARDAANTLAQRNGTAAQTFNLYGTYTDASNYERLSFIGAVGSFTIAAQSAGTGTANIALTLANKGTAVTALTGQTVGTTVGVAGAAAALPAAPLGYLSLNINGTAVRVPYYN